MSTKHGLQHARLIRQILVKHWVDLGRMRINCLDGHVILRGTITPLYGANGVISGEKVVEIIANIRNLPETIAVDFCELKFDNGTSVISAVADDNG